jgi:hypothetical protein
MECRQALTEGRITQQRFAALREFYNNHDKQAHVSLETARQAIQVAARERAKQVAALEGERLQLSEAVGLGALNRTEANKESQRLTRQLQVLSEESTQLGQSLVIDDVETLGGFLDLSLEEYHQETPAAPRGQALPFFLLIYGAPLLAALCVFVPWLRVGSVAESLVTVYALFDLHSIDPPLPIGSMRSLWYVFFIIPLLALPAAATSHQRRAARGLIAVGFAAVGCALVALVLLVLTVDHPAFGITRVVGSVGRGFIGYLIGGLAIVLIGRERLHRADSQRPVARAFVGPAIATLLMIVMLTTRSFAPPLPPQVSLAAMMDNQVFGLVRILCRNEGVAPVSVHVPWSSSARSASATSDSMAIGFDVLVKERGDDIFRSLPQSELCWSTGGLPVLTEENDLAPRLSLAFEFDARRLRSLGIDAEALRITMTSKGGEEIGVYEAPLPEDLPAPPLARRSAEQANAVPQPGPAAALAMPSPAMPAMPAPLAPLPAALPAVQDAGVILRLVGSYKDSEGDAVRVSISPTDGTAPQRLSLHQGDPVTGEWSVESVSINPLGATLRHGRSGDLLTLRKREDLLIRY